ncbi:hypothetical protein VPNG_01823 [Cytospora leucostoma]|uniref:Uncharacterized protein n=1 Tax=Cytospora leucostoma TaxID=1230097 RepID=A0A423XIK9_9PEZI|nr:hypothetical protein VPNG_01823 [Cytospora leucostoma]
MLHDVLRRRLDGVLELGDLGLGLEFRVCPRGRWPPPLGELDSHRGRLAKVIVSIERQPAPGDDPLPFPLVRAPDPDHDGDPDTQLLVRVYDALRDRVPPRQPAEYVDEDDAHPAVLEDRLEGLPHRLAGGLAARVEEVGHLAPGVRQRVHGVHGQARAVGQRADVARPVPRVQPVVHDAAPLGLPRARVPGLERAEGLVHVPQPPAAPVGRLVELDPEVLHGEGRVLLVHGELEAQVLRLLLLEDLAEVPQHPPQGQPVVHAPRLGDLQLLDQPGEEALRLLLGEGEQAVAGRGGQEDLVEAHRGAPHPLPPYDGGGEALRARGAVDAEGEVPDGIAFELEVGGLVFVRQELLAGGAVEVEAAGLLERDYGRNNTRSRRSQARTPCRCVKTASLLLLLLMMMTPPHCGSCEVVHGLEPGPLLGFVEELLPQRGPNLRRVVHHERHTCILEGRDLLVGMRLARQPERTGVAHDPVHGRLLARDEGDDGLPLRHGRPAVILPDPLGGQDLAVAADLPYEGDGPGVRVRLQHLQRLDEVRAGQDVAPDADAQALPEPGARGGRDGLVAQGPGPGCYADAPGAEARQGLEPDPTPLALGGVDDAGGVGPHQPALGLGLEHAVDPQHVVEGHVLGDGDDERHLGLDGLLYGVGCHGGGDVDARRIRFELLHGPADGRQDGQAEVLGFAAGDHAPDNVGAPFDRLLGVGGCMVAREALEYDTGLAAYAEVL